MEIFKNIPGIDNYRISDKQNIISLIDNKGNSVKRILSTRKMRNGYIRATLYVNGKRKDFSVHRLIASAFHGLDLNNKKQLALHKNDIRDDNNPNNIFIGTHKDNIMDCITKGRGVDNRGEKNGMRRLTNEQVKQIKNIYTGKRGEQTKIAKQFSVPASTIWQIVNGIGWKHIL